MRNKTTIKKTNSPRKRVSSTTIAEVVRCAPSTVRMVLGESRNADTTTGERILCAAMILETGFENVIINAKKILNHQ